MQGKVLVFSKAMYLDLLYFQKTGMLIISHVLVCVSACVRLSPSNNFLPNNFYKATYTGHVTGSYIFFLRFNSVSLLITIKRSLF